MFKIHSLPAPTDRASLSDGTIFRFTEDQLPASHSFADTTWGVTFRASVVRIVLFKLLGTAILAACMASSESTGRYGAYSCALAAAVNFVAAVHYFLIWKVRSQRMSGRYEMWTMRAPAKQYELVGAEKEDAATRSIVFAQELMVDSYRFSDWICTLVLMTLDLGAQREFATLADDNNFFDLGRGPMPISKEIVASLQAAMVGCGALYRFYFNEVRYERNPKGGPPTPPKLGTLLGGLASFLVSCGLFCVICWALLSNTAKPGDNRYAPKILEDDTIALFVLVLVWVGYPVVMLVARIWLWTLPGDAYSSNLSLFKDTAFGTLDVTSKAGLAIFVAARAHWCDASCELDLVGSS